MNPMLLPLSWLYCAAVAARNAAFDLGLLHQNDAGVPVISVGNMTAGGTGKTPLTGYCVELLLARGMHPSVVSRGYGRRSRGVVIVAQNGVIAVNAAQGGDEPVQLARRYPRASVVVGERRAAAAAVAVQQCGTDVIVMDDGFQHRYLRRNADIVALDARRDIRHEPMLPAGMRREWLKGLCRASLLVFTRCERNGLPAWSGELSPALAGRMAGCRFRIDGFSAIPGGATTTPAGPVVAFSGIANHAEFVRSLAEAGVVVGADRGFPDHHWYTKDEIAGVAALARNTGAAAVVTTEKDLVRLDADPAVEEELLRGPAPMAARLAANMVEGGDLLEKVIEDCLKGEEQSW